MAEPIDIVKKSLIRKRSPEMNMDYGKLPPQVKDLEEAVLGAIMIEKEAIEDVIQILNEECFYVDAHQRIWKAIRIIYDRSDPIDLLTVTEQLKKQGDLDAAGGPFYIAQLTNKIGSAANIEYHSRLIQEKHIARKTISVCSEAIKDAYEDATDVFDLVDNLGASVSEIGEVGNKGQASTSMSAGITAEIKDLDKRMTNSAHITGVETGFAEMNQIVGGWQKTDLIIVAARPAMGKCLMICTKIIMYDGTLKMVQDIVVGDLLMGIDSKPREVMSLARGREMMYWVKQESGITYGVNESHILSLLHKERDSDKIWMDDICNISVWAYLNKTESFRNGLCGYKYNHVTKKIFGLTEITIEQDKVDDYYGFTLDQDGLFLLEDGTVTHNTAYCLALAINAATKGENPTPVAVFSLEMSTSQLIQRAVSSETGISTEKIRKGKLDDYEYNRLTGGIDKLKAAPIYIDDTPALSMFELRNKARTLKKKHGIGLIIIDYLQLMTGSSDKPNGNREQEIASISRGLKTLAKELDVPVIALSQLSRAVETRQGDKKPILSDLRECLSTETSMIYTQDGVSHNQQMQMDLLSLNDSSMIGTMGSDNIPKSENVVYRLKLKSGRFLDATLKHRILTKDDYKELGEITEFDKIACALNFSSKSYPKSITGFMDSLKDELRFMSDSDVEYIYNIVTTCGCMGVNMEISAASLQMAQQRLYQLSKVGVWANFSTVQDKYTVIIECTEIERRFAEFMRYEEPEHIHYDTIESITEIGVRQIFDRSVPITNNFIVNGIIVHNSGAIENDADIIIFLYRGEYYGIETDSEGNPTKGIGEAIIAKHRNGALASVKMRFVKEFTKFEDLNMTVSDTGHLEPTNEKSQWKSMGERAKQYADKPIAELPPGTSQEIAPYTPPDEGGHGSYGDEDAPF